MGANLKVDGVNTDVYVTPYKSYVANLTQLNVGEVPVATVMNADDTNFLGNIVWTRLQAGRFHGTLTGAFIEGKTYLPSLSTTNPPGLFTIYRVDNNVVELSSFSVDYQTGVATGEDTWLYETAIEIRVYPA